MKKLWALIQKHYDILAYLFFGALTTVVNYLVFFPCYNAFQLSEVTSNVIAWVVSVAFAYLTNKPFVFKSHDWSAKTVFPELGKFVGCRIGSLVVETVLLFITVSLLSFDANLMKVLISVLVVIINYVGSKLLVFRKTK